MADSVATSSVPWSISATSSVWSSIGDDGASILSDLTGMIADKEEPAYFAIAQMMVQCEGPGDRKEVLQVLDMVHQWLELYRERDDRGRDEPRYMSELFQAELVNKTVRDYRRTNTGHESEICIETLAEAWQSEQVEAEPRESFLRDLEDLFKRAIPVTIEWGVKKTTEEMHFEELVWDQDTLGKRLAKVFTDEAQRGPTAWMRTDDKLQREVLLNGQMWIEDDKEQRRGR